MVFITSFTEMYQFFKLPFLIEHYYEHKEQNDAMPLFSFLVNHYCYNKFDKDFDDDMKLPFKSHECLTNSTILTMDTSQCGCLSLKLFHIQSISYHHFDESFILTSFLPNIWQPPKIS